jgi:hypothetical protein
MIRQRLSDQKAPDRFSGTRVLAVVLGFACAAILLAPGCSRPVEPAPVVAIEHEILPEPAWVGPARVTLKLADAAAQPVTGARITIEANMSHAGMSPLFAEAKESDPGRYQAGVEFSMAGDWVILLHVTLPGGKKLERQFDVRGVRPN